MLVDFTYLFINIIMNVITFPLSLAYIHVGGCSGIPDKPTTINFPSLRGARMWELARLKVRLMMGSCSGTEVRLVTSGQYFERKMTHFYLKRLAYLPNLKQNIPPAWSWCTGHAASGHHSHLPSGDSRWRREVLETSLPRLVTYYYV